MRNTGPVTTPARSSMLRVVPPRAKARVQAWSVDALQPAVRDALRTFLREEWPASVGGTAGWQPRVLCYGPTDWLVVSNAAPEALLTGLASALKGTPLTVIDQSQALAALEVTGEQGRALLSKACALDLHPRAFPAGACARTRLAHVPVVIDAAADAPLLTCYVARSYRDYLHAWLSDAALEIQDQNP